MLVDEAFPRIFLNSEHLVKGPVVLTIDRMVRENHRTPGKPGTSQDVWMLWFVELEARAKRDPSKETKRWELSRTTFQLIAKVTGKPNSDDWHGCCVTLYRTTIGERDGGKSNKPCIGVRRPADAELAAHAKRWAWLFGEPADQGEQDDPDELGEDGTDEDEIVAWLLHAIDECRTRAELSELKAEQIDGQPEAIRARVMPRYGQRWNELKPEG